MYHHHHNYHHHHHQLHYHTITIIITNLIITITTITITIPSTVLPEFRSQYAKADNEVEFLQVRGWSSDSNGHVCFCPISHCIKHSLGNLGLLLQSHRDQLLFQVLFTLLFLATLKKFKSLNYMYIP